MGQFTIWVYFILSEETSFNRNDFSHLFAFLLASSLATTPSCHAHSLVICSLWFILLLRSNILFTFLRLFVHDRLPLIGLRLGWWPSRQTREALILHLQVDFLRRLVELLHLFRLALLLIGEHIHSPRGYRRLRWLILCLPRFRLLWQSAKCREISL